MASAPEKKATNDNLQRSLDSAGSTPPSQYFPVEVYATKGTISASHGSAGDICADLTNNVIKMKGTDGNWH